MTLILSLLLVFIVGLALTKEIKAYSKGFYLLASVGAMTTTAYEIYKLLTNYKLTGFIGEIERSFMKGYLSMGFFILVMFAGLFSKKGILNKKLFANRAENAILGTILILPHGVMYLVKFLNGLLQGKPLGLLYVIFVIVGLIAFIIMIPLFITSFAKIRAKMNYKKWKAIQRWAYLFYILAYAHIVVGYAIGSVKIISMITYSTVFGLYFILKLVKVSYRG